MPMEGWFSTENLHFHHIFWFSCGELRLKQSLWEKIGDLGKKWKIRFCVIFWLQMVEILSVLRYLGSEWELSLSPCSSLLSHSKRTVWFLFLVCSLSRQLSTFWTSFYSAWSFPTLPHDRKLFKYKDTGKTIGNREQTTVLHVTCQMHRLGPIRSEDHDFVDYYKNLINKNLSHIDIPSCHAISTLENLIN